MALERGMRKVKEAKARAEAARARGSQGGGILRLFLKPGESQTMRFWGDFENEEAPIMSKRHFIKRLPGAQKYQQCGQNAPDGAHQGCVFCYQLENCSDKGISRPSDISNFLVESKHRYHVLEQEVRVLKPGVSLRSGMQAKPTDYVLTKYPACYSSKRRPCPYCEQGNEAKVTGFRHWELAATYADQVVALQEILRTYCRCGARDSEGNGTIEAVQYLCSNCGSPVDFSPERGQVVANCAKCNRTLPPNEEVECSECDSPTRCDLQDFWVRVSRNGGGTDTTYNFEPIHPCAPPTDEETKAMEDAKPNWEDVLAPEPAAIQAAALGVMNPFDDGQHGSVSYGADSATDEPDYYVDHPKPVQVMKRRKPILKKS